MRGSLAGGCVITSQETEAHRTGAGEAGGAGPGAGPPRAAPMNVFSVSALGIGAMVGAGIFALLGQAVLVAGRFVLLSFLIGGVLALLAGYSIAKLAVRFPERGGLPDYLADAFPRGLFAPTLSLIYLITLVIGVAAVAKSFGLYAARLLLGQGGGPWVAHAMTVAMILVVATLNLVGSRAVGRAEVVLVAIKTGVLLLLIGAGFASFRGDLLAAGPGLQLASMTSAVGLTFFAYTGFGVMANAAASVGNPQKVMPVAILLAITSVTLLYLALALVVLGNLSPEQLGRAADTAVAEAARPALGQFGFVIVSIGGLMATASSTNASFFSILNLNEDLAQRGPLPRLFARKVMQVPVGFLLALLTSMLLTLGFHLGEIANLAGLGFLVAYLGVFAAHWRLRPVVGGSRGAIVLGAALIGGVLVGSIVHLALTQRAGLGLLILMLGCCALAAWCAGRQRAPAR